MSSNIDAFSLIPDPFHTDIANPEGEAILTVHACKHKIIADSGVHINSEGNEQQKGG